MNMHEIFPRTSQKNECESIFVSVCAAGAASEDSATPLHS